MGLDVFRHILAKGISSSLQAVAFRMANVAITLSNLGYRPGAGALFRVAYEILPQASAIRAAYARFLLNEGDPQNANAVQLGQEVSIPKPDDRALREALADVPPRFYDGPQWWDEYEIPEIVEAFPALRP
jgi:hypothetical protein